MWKEFHCLVNYFLMHIQDVDIKEAVVVWFTVDVQNFNFMECP